MKKLEKLNQNLFVSIQADKITNLSNIVGGNWVKYTGNGTTTGDKEVRTGNQDGGGDATDPKEGKDTYETTPSCDMGGIYTTSDKDTVDPLDPNSADTALATATDTPSAF